MAITSETTREIQLARRPQGMPQPADFRLVERPIPRPGAGQMLVRNLYMSVDPYMRGRMRDIKSYVPPFQLDTVIDGGSLGVVVESNLAGFTAGDYVLGFQGWREHYLSDGAGQRKVDPALAPLSAYLGALGMPGLTAYVGLLDLGQPKEGETVFVSGAAGAVGSIVGQIARIRGCRAAGSAGSPDKVRHLIDDLGFDAAFNYRGADLQSELRRVCPGGIDVYFDNVGGAMLEAVLLNMRPHGRIPVCGMIGQYNDSEPPAGPRTLIAIIPSRIRLEGFIVSDHQHRMPDFLRDMSGWLASGAIRYRETILEGIENAPRAFIGLFAGENTGKMLVRLSPDPALG